MKPSETQKLINNSKNAGRTYVGSRTSILGVEENVGIADDKRLLHVLNTGPTGYGKTQLLIHAALQDAHKDNGFCMVIPKGDAIDQVLAKLPDNRRDDILYINPGHEIIPAINVLEPCVTEEMTSQQIENQKEIIVSDLIDLFKRQSENWGSRFGRVLETLLRAHIELNIKNRETNSLLDVFRCVIQSDALTELIDRTHDTVVREQLVRIKEDLTSYQMEPLQRRLNDFVMNSTVRKIVSAEESDLSFRDALNQRKIVLVDIQKGELGDTVSQLVGSIVITKVWAAAQSRISQVPEQRTPFYLYVDELQNFSSEDSALSKMLSEAREYRLGCWLATQFLHQLPTLLRRSVTNNCRTKICFNPGGSDDETRIAGMFQGIDNHRLKSLGKYRGVIQSPSDHYHRPAMFFNTFPPWNADRKQVEKIKQQQAVGTEPVSEPEVVPSLGKAANSGGKTHTRLLIGAKENLEERGFKVDLLYQDVGGEKPDGQVHLPDGKIAHLEVEDSTLSKPGKVLKNLQRAADQGRECIFVVKEGDKEKLENIVSDPVNRRGNNHEDQNGSYSHYTDIDGGLITDPGQLQDTGYRVLELTENDLTTREQTEKECPELDNNSREDLENFCLYRTDSGYCTELETGCVLHKTDQ
jgi:hypothetical protein